MIYLHTGQPGAGKTLYTIATVRQLAQKEGRAVYFSGIADCSVPGWIELPEATDWASVPSGSIIVIDEAQRIFRPRHVGSKVPEYVEHLETHRHKGLDLFLVTQHPSLVETNVRRLVGTHRHIMRMFGSKAAVVHEWNEVRTDCDTKRDGSVSSTWPYPSDVFRLYKSAEVHTHKARIPLRVWLLMLAPLMLGGIGYGLYKWISHKTGASAVPSSQTMGIQAGSSAKKGEALTAEEWVGLRRPRVQGLAYTAPAYDSVTQPVTAPYPAICIASESKCRCYSQQATRLDLAESLCRSLAERGHFRDWQDGRERQTSQGGGSLATPPPAGAVAPSAPSASAVPVAQSAPVAVSGPLDVQGSLPRVIR